MRSLLIILPLLAGLFARAATGDGPSIGEILPTSPQLSGQWSSNEILVVTDPLNAPAEVVGKSENPARWLAHAHELLLTTRREAYAVIRYRSGSTNCLVYVSRWKNKE